MMGKSSRDEEEAWCLTAIRGLGFDNGQGDFECGWVSSTYYP